MSFRPLEYVGKYTGDKCSTQIYGRRHQLVQQAGLFNVGVPPLICRSKLVS